MTEMTEDDFLAAYTLCPNPLNPDAGWSVDDDRGCMFETYGAELEYVRGFDPQRVWTIVHGSNGGEYILSGFHVVNRVGYLISEQCVPASEEIQISL